MLRRPQFIVIIPLLLLGFGIFLTLFALVPEEQQPPAKQTKTLKFFILQRTADLISPSQIDPTFEVFVGEASPVIKSAIIELRGIQVSPGASPTVQVSIDDIPLASARVVTYNMDTASGTRPFRIFYDASSYMATQITGPGTYTFTLSVKANNITLSVLSARLRLTYQFTPPSAGGTLPVTGELASSVFDTGVTDGAAYNSITWKGTLVSGTKVRFQLATSNCSNAATNPPTCSPAGTWSFLGGATCGSGDWYDASNTDKSVETTCSAHNNNRYYRYKVQLCSGDCSTAGTVTSTVTDVNVSWSP